MCAAHFHPVVHDSQRLGSLLSLQIDHVPRIASVDNAVLYVNAYRR